MANAMHEIECLGEEHDEICQICALHDHHSYQTPTPSKFQPVSPAEKPGVVYKIRIPRNYSTNYFSRGPPSSFHS